MDELRWFLLVVGLLVIAGIYGFTRWQERQRNNREGHRPSRRDAFADDHDVDEALRDLDASIGEIDPVEPVSRPLPVVPDEPELSIEEPEWRRETRVERPRPPAKPPAEPASEKAAPVPQGLEEKIVVIHVAAANGRMFGGRDLVAALEAAGLHYGEHQIFHHSMDTGNGHIALFSAANMLKPGIFDLDQLEQMRSPGIAMFMQLPAPFDGLKAFEQMLETGRQIAAELGATLLDARRCNLTQQAIEHIREELREYRRRAHLQARQQMR
jgi:cell division protein ZipA